LLLPADISPGRARARARSTPSTSPAIGQQIGQSSGGISIPDVGGVRARETVATVNVAIFGAAGVVESDGDARILGDRALS
jgi:hypothetical protein